MKLINFLRMLLVVLLLSFGLVSCTQKEPLTKQQATDIGLNAIKALDQGDYKAYTRDFTVMMKSVVPEKDFMAYHETAQQNLGKFVNFEKVEQVPAETEGFIRWQYTCVFEKGKMLLSLVFKENGRRIESVHFANAG